MNASGLTLVEEQALTMLARLLDGPGFATSRARELTDGLVALVAGFATRPGSDHDDDPDRWFLASAGDQLSVLGEGLTLHARLCQSRPETIRLSHGTNTATIGLGPADERRASIAVDGSPTAHYHWDGDRLIDDLAARVDAAEPPRMVSLDHVGGASVITARPMSKPVAVTTWDSTRAELESLRDLTRPPATKDHMSDVVCLCVAIFDRVLEAIRLDDERPMFDDGWALRQTATETMIIGPALFLLVANDQSSASVVSGPTKWNITSVDSSGQMLAVPLLEAFTHITNEIDDATRTDWTLGLDARLVADVQRVPPESAVEPSAPTPTPAIATWDATHLVGPESLAVGGVPSGTFAPGTKLDVGLDVRLIEINADGWALVECSNTWQCYVAAAGLITKAG